MRIGDDEVCGAEADICAAVLALLREANLDQLTVADVARQAGVSRSTFYRHFGSVADVVASMQRRFMDAIERINRLSLQAPRSRGESTHASASMVARVELYAANREFILAMEGPHGDAAFQKNAEKVFRDYLAARLAADTMPKEKMELYAAFVAAGHYALVRAWLADYPDMPTRDVAELLNKLLYSSVALP